MNGTQVLLICLAVLSKLKPSGSPPPEKPSFSELYQESLDKAGAVMGLTEPPEQTMTITEIKPVKAEMSLPNNKPGVATACISCSRAHLATVTGALSEALRFARDGGIADPEVIRRVNLAENEVNIMERIDLSPASIAASPLQEQQIAHAYLPRIRKLRQDIGAIASVESLEKVAADSEALSVEFRLAHLKAKGVNVEDMVGLAMKVKSGELTMEQAKKKAKLLAAPATPTQG